MIVSDRYNLWTKGPYTSFAQAKELAEKMIEESNTGLVTEVTITMELGVASLAGRVVVWETTTGGTT